MDDLDLAQGNGTRVLERADENAQTVLGSCLQCKHFGKNKNKMICCLNHATQLEVMLNSVMSPGVARTHGEWDEDLQEFSELSGYQAVHSRRQVWDSWSNYRKGKLSALSIPPELFYI